MNVLQASEKLMGEFTTDIIFFPIYMYGKALGNGYAITAVVGKEEIMKAAETSFISSTFWTEAIGPSAALATLKEMARQQSWTHLPTKGKQVKEIWDKSSKENGIKTTINGINALPTFTFDEEDAVAELSSLKTCFPKVFWLQHCFTQQWLTAKKTSNYMNQPCKKHL